MKDIKELAQKHGWDASLLRDAVRDAGGRVDALLGCGSIGCTFQAEGLQENTVLKLTADQGEFDLWLTMFELQESRHRTTSGVPRVYDAGTVAGIGSDVPAYYVVREAVEPLVMGSHMNVSPRTRAYLFPGLKDLPDTLVMQDDWRFANLAERLQQGGYGVTRVMYVRCEQFDEDLRKLYDLTDVTNLAESQPSLRDKLWKESYAKSARSVRPPLAGIGRMVASLLLETGSTWVTDLHMGNLGWRLTSKPQVLAYDWLTAELIPNGKLV
jgi:hypothetical protein